jgi:hypothetical protein
MSPPSKEWAVRTGTTYHRRPRARFALLGAALGGLVLWRLRPFGAVVRGESMMPTLADGDVVVAFARARPRTGDVVVLERPDRTGFEMVKRVVASPGDVVRGLLGGWRPPGPLALGPGEWFVVGDAPGRSTDSRSFGPVAGADLRGVVRLVLWPPERFGLVARPHEDARPRSAAE